MPTPTLPTVVEARAAVAAAEVLHAAALRIYEEGGRVEAHRLAVAIAWDAVRAAERGVVLAALRATRDRWAAMADEADRQGQTAWAARVRAEIGALGIVLARGDPTACIVAVTGAAARITEPCHGTPQGVLEAARQVVADTAPNADGVRQAPTRGHVDALAKALRCRGDRPT